MIAATVGTALAVAVGAVAGFLAEVGSGPVPAEASVAPMTAAQVAGMFREYGDRGAGWTGGDSTVSVALPDGRIVWLFSDTFLGVVNPDGSRPADTPMVNNTMVVQEGTELVETRHGGSAGWPSAPVTPEAPGEFLWVADGMVESGVLKVLYSRYSRFGGEILDVELVGTSLATFSLPELTLTSVTDLPAGDVITWGAALLPDGDHTYVYGTSTGLAGMTYGHLARAAAGDLGGAWQYWTGDSWSDVEDNATRFMTGVGNAYAVQRIGEQYVLVTQQSNLVFDPQLVAYTAPSPTGPFEGPVTLLTAPEQEPGTERIVYAARLHPDLAAPGKLLMSYDVNSLDQDDVFADARLYRPRFVDVAWPLPQPDPGELPEAPAGLAATPDDEGRVNLGWQPVEGATGYHVHQRDVTAGQSHFVRLRQPVEQTSTRVGGLITGHTYEFRVTAAGEAGAGPASATVTARARIANDATVIDGSNAPGAIADSYMVRLKDTTAVREAGVAAIAEQLLAQAGGGTVDRLYARTLRGFAATLTESQAIDLTGHPDVLDVEQDRTMAPTGVQLDPPSWGLDRIDQREPRARDQRYVYPNDGAGVTVYVVDSGIRVSHPTFGGRATYGASTLIPRPPGAPPHPIADDCMGHGTHVAGTAGGTDYGVAKRVDLVAVKVFDCAGNSTATSVIDGIEWVIDHAQRPAVINLSLGERVSWWHPERPTDLEIAVQVAIDAGITVVAAAGNNNGDACDISPARLDEAITVGAIDEDDARWRDGLSSGSNYGQCVDLFAPGTNIVSAGIDPGDDPYTDTGTSMAAPHVTGAVAMTLSAHPALGPAQVERVLLGAATTGVVQNPGSGSPNRLLFIEQPPTDAPQHLFANPNPDGTIGLGWDTVAGDNLHYVVYQRDVTAGQTTFTRWAEPVFDGTTATARNLISGHTYEFTVAAANSMGIGPQSNIARATAQVQPPDPPTNLTATANQDGTITLDWTAPATPDVWYWVYQRDVTAEETEFTQLPLPVADCCSFTAGYLTHDHEYEFQLTAINQTGESAASNVARARALHPPTAPPTNLRAVAGDGEVTLTWTASPTPNVWYWVYQRDVTAEETEFTQLPLPVTGCCSFTAGYLANGNEYEFKLTAIGPGGESAGSNLVRATPLPAKPPKVTGLTATAQPDGTIRLNWNPIDKVYFWILQRNVTAGEGFTRISVPTEGTSFTAGLLTHNDVYEFRVLAENLAGEGPASDPVRATSRYQPPGRPGNLQAVTSGDGHIDLDWTPPGPGDFYYWIYYRDVTAGQTSFTRSSLPTDRTSARQGPLVHGHEYEFKVSAENPGGEGSASAPVRVVSRGGLPLPPSGLTATAGDGQVALRWTASPSPSVYFWIEYRPRGGAWQRIDVPVTTCCTHTVRLLTNGTTYDFRLRATNASGDSAASNVASARPMPPLPQPPSGLTATAGDGQVALRWTASPSPSVYYWIEHRANGGAWQRIQIPVTTCCTHTVRLLTNGTTYDFRLRATNLSGDSAPSNVARARPMPPLPGAPTNLTARSEDGSVFLRWAGSPTPSVWYWIEYRELGGGWQRLAYPLTTCCSFTVSYLRNGTTYEFRVRATNLAGDGPPSNVARATPQPSGRCHAWAGNPTYWGYNSDVYVMQTRGSGMVACIGPVANVEVSVTLYPVPADDPRDPTTSTQWWGSVNNDRLGTISVTNNAFAYPSYRCLAYVTMARASWTLDGNPHGAVHFSPTVHVGPDCVPPA